MLALKMMLKEIKCPKTLDHQLNKVKIIIKDNVCENKVMNLGFVFFYSKSKTSINAFDGF
jgi:hypothetical protein